MALTNPGSGPPPFLIIGENLHASRVLRRDGGQVVPSPGGREALRFVDGDGAERFLAIPDEVKSAQDWQQGKLKHVRAALVAGLTGGDDARDGSAYLQALALRQVRAGAAYLDLNVDEMSADAEVREAAMRWLVRTVEAVTNVSIALDSSSLGVLRAGLSASARRGGPPLLNSASLERLEAVDVAVEAGCPVVLTAIGAGGLPGTVAERVGNATRLVELAVGKGVELAGLFVDPLVLPVAVNSRAAMDFLEAVRELRRRLGPQVHLTGGLSNLSFGLPARRLINGVFVAMAREAGADSAILDPVALNAADPGPGPESPVHHLVTDLIEGRDPYGRRYLKAFREGHLGSGSPRPA